MYWVATEILVCSSMQKRALTIKRFIKLAICLRTVNNFNALFAILSGLANVAVSRLKLTWEVIPYKSLLFLFFIFSHSLHLMVPHFLTHSLALLLSITLFLSPLSPSPSLSLQRVPAKYAGKLEELQSGMDPSRNMRNYRMMFSAAEPPMIPFFRNAETSHLTHFTLDWS